MIPPRHGIGTPMKLAVTDFAALILTTQVVSEDVSHPVQPAKMDNIAGVAVRVTTVSMS